MSPPVIFDDDDFDYRGSDYINPNDTLYVPLARYGF
jgi:hypothetical protein